MEDFNKAYREKQSLLTKLSWQKGTHDSMRKVVARICIRKECVNAFKTIPSDPKKYCSRSCAAIINNAGQNRHPQKEKRFCVNCQAILNKRSKLKYCSRECHTQFYYNKWIEAWKKGEKEGGVGITARNLSTHLKKYLHEKFEHKCARCWWNTKHPTTGTIPLEIEHIDGNAENNQEENLTLLCPNCHALTPFYKNLNKGNGRKWRMNKYIKNVV